MCRCRQQILYRSRFVKEDVSSNKKSSETRTRQWKERLHIKLIQSRRNRPAKISTTSSMGRPTQNYSMSNLGLSARTVGQKNCSRSRNTTNVKRRQERTSSGITTGQRRRDWLTCGAHVKGPLATAMSEKNQVQFELLVQSSNLNKSYQKDTERKTKERLTPGVAMGRPTQNAVGRILPRSSPHLSRTS